MPPPESTANPTSLAECQLEEARINLEAARIRNTLSILANQAIGQDTDERKKYAKRFLWLACAWVVVVAFLLIIQGFCTQGCRGFVFRLSDSVLLAAIGSTTANIVGILYVVANYLFPKK
jgi:hypothetical protein